MLLFPEYHMLNIGAPFTSVEICPALHERDLELQHFCVTVVTGCTRVVCPARQWPLN
jgi:hypothetical protein